MGDELHEIGVRMVADFFEIEGWDTYYLGANTPKESILKIIVDENVDILAILATMAFHISAVRELINSIRSAKEKLVKNSIISKSQVFIILYSIYSHYGMTFALCDNDSRVVIFLRNQNS